MGSAPVAMELIHTCYRIGDIDRSVAFYEALGFEERRRMPIRDEAINVFMGLPGDGDRLELTYNFGVDSYELGTGYNHIALTVADLDGTLAELAGKGIEPGEAAVPRAARAARGSASCATPTATGSSSSRSAPGRRRGSGLTAEARPRAAQNPGRDLEVVGVAAARRPAAAARRGRRDRLEQAASVCASEIVAWAAASLIWSSAVMLRLSMSSQERW